MDACPRWPLASWQLRVTSALSHPDSASTWNAGLWPSPLKRTRHLKASKSHDWCFTQLCSSHPCMARKQGIARAMSEGPSPRANSVLERWLRRVFPFCFPWPGQMPVLKLEGKHIIKICLPPSQIYLFPFDKQWFHFSSRPEFFFSFSFKLSPGQRGKRLFAHVLICQTRHYHALTTILGTSPCLPRLQPKGNFPTQLSPSPNTLF